MIMTKQLSIRFRVENDRQDDVFHEGIKQLKKVGYANINDNLQWLNDEVCVLFVDTNNEDAPSESDSINQLGQYIDDSNLKALLEKLQNELDEEADEEWDGFGDDYEEE